MGTAADAVVAGVWVPQDVRSADLPVRYGYDLSPQGRGQAWTQA
jgi:hypothetical protein